MLFKKWPEEQTNEPAGEAQDQGANYSLAKACDVEAKAEPVGDVIHDVEQSGVDHEGDQAQSQDVNREGDDSDDVADNRVDHSEYGRDYQIRHHHFHGGGTNEDDGVIGVGGKRQAGNSPDGYS